MSHTLHRRHESNWRNGHKRRARVLDRAAENPRRFFHGCAGKKSWPSRKQALAFRVSLENHSTTYEDWENKATQEPYRCLYCAKWHLGHGRKAQ